MPKKKRKLTEEQKRKISDAAFRRKIRNIFTNAGFESINTINKHIKIGHRILEIDNVFIFENVMLICEDTTAASVNKEHIRKKKEAFDEIADNFSDFMEWLCQEFTDKENQLRKYEVDRYNVFNLYVSQHEINLTEDDRTLYSNICFIDPHTLGYFHKITQSIRLSARYEIFRFLGLKQGQVGVARSEGGRKCIKAPIIYPRGSTGLKNGVRIVSFMMSAGSLLQTCYVMRKDNWEDSIWLYQRLIEKDKIKNIRNFMVKKGQAFYNNIIVGLPDNVWFVDHNENPVPLEDIGDYESCSLEIPDDFNSICVIDGQHRIFAHYEGPASDKQEEKVAQLRNELHLLVTGLIFPKDMPPIERAQFQSEIFLDINSNAKPVPAEVLLHIEMIRNPYSGIGLARRIIEKLNQRKIFLNMFELNSLGESKIKVASIIKFALRYLVTIHPAEGRVSLYTYWDGDKEALEAKNESALEEYIRFCVDNLDIFFSAIRKSFINDWTDRSTKMLSVISLNGFIIAYNRQLVHNGIQDFNFFDSKFKNLKIDFSKENFMYTSSQYRKFSDQILGEAFDLKQSEVTVIE